MKFGDIIREVGLKPWSTPLASDLSIVLYDEKRTKIVDDPLRFACPIFASNPESHTQFKNFLANLEARLQQADLNPENLKNGISLDSLVFAQITEHMLFVSIPPEMYMAFPRKHQR